MTWRMRKELANVQVLELNLADRHREFITSASVRQDLARCATLAQDGVKRLTDTLVPPLCTASDLQACHAVLTKEIRAALFALAEALR